ncbi:nucleoside-diphosphate sugar epimerase/dehydratase [Nocardioides currus]|uniref:Polysaccharide biosynthesis protein n=1 Tax=Nocardioides currus TaxID=2133958 RepID=A0A2R7Z322_9ACTN|nr:nucleoside-diphosphate sugar epimerase/dehydratase [Nocardioides currus]PUA83031.1 polysaccharide biosynthesis protein [Nocardioides currus]
MDTQRPGVRGSIPRAAFDTPWVRRGVLAALDVLAWTLALGLIIGIRLDFAITDVESASVLRYWIAVGILLVATGYASKFYRGRFLVGSFDEALGLALHVGAVSALAIVLQPLVYPGLPRSIPVLVPPVALLLSAASRWLYRAFRDRSETGGQGELANVIIYGAGEAGRQVANLLRNQSDLAFRVVGYVDDNPGKRHLRIHGVPVLGSGDALGEIAEDYDARAVVFAVPNASGALIGEVQERAQDAELDFFVLPRVNELIGGQVEVADIRRVEIGDVLGRHQVATDLNAIAGYLTGKRVLITGAGGSIGSELARQVHKFGPATLIMLDRDESGLHSVQLSVYGRGLLDNPDTVLVDIRDLESLRAVFAEHQPQIVFHAAALKHLPMLERFPDEGWKTNVLGTLNLLTLAAEFDVEHFVNISTDKAADATSVLGLTKRTAEQLTAWQAEQTGLPYISVRFGNVLGSRGSMLHTFNAQIAAGGPITVTHPDVTRYFMTIPEACELVVQAGAIGRAGEVMVLEMGEPVKILDVAKRMVRLSGARSIEIVFTGLRTGEKLHEKLFGDEEQSRSTDHPMIRTVAVPTLAPDDLRMPTRPDRES